MSEDLRHDGGDVEGGRVHVREVGVHVLGQYEQPNKAGPFWQPEQLGRPQHHCSTALYRQTPSWKGRDLQNRQRFWFISKISNLSKLVVCTYLSKFVKTLVGKFDDFLTVCQYYCIVNIVKCQQWISTRKEILENHNMINSEIWRVFFSVWQPNKAGPFWQPEQLGRPQHHCSTLQTPSWKGRDLQKSSLSKVFMVFWICQNWTCKLVQVCRTYHYTSKSVSKIGKIPAGKFDEFLTVCQYCQMSTLDFNEIPWNRNIWQLVNVKINQNLSFLCKIC